MILLEIVKFTLCMCFIGIFFKYVMHESGTVEWLLVGILAPINSLKGFIQIGHTLEYFVKVWIKKH